jgi:hypothetical protein
VATRTLLDTDIWSEILKVLTIAETRGIPVKFTGETRGASR